MVMTADCTSPSPPPQTKYDDVFGDTPRARKRIRRLRILDRIVASLITTGGVAIILAVFGIFFFVTIEAIPLVFPGSAEERHVAAGLLGRPTGRALAVGEDEYRETGWLLTESGVIRLMDFVGGGIVAEVALEELGAAEIRCGARAAGADVLVAGTDDGRVLVAGVAYRSIFEDGRRARQEVRVDWQTALTLREDDGPIDHVAVSSDGEELVIVAAATGFLGVAQKKVDGRRVRLGVASAALGGDAATALALDEPAETLVVGLESGQVLRFELDREDAELVERLTAGGAPITALSFVFGSRTLLVGDDRGEISGWQGIRSTPDSRRTMSRVREFDPMSAAITAFAPSRRNKAFLVVDRSGEVRIEHTTTEREVVSLAVPSGSTAATLSPRFDGLTLADGEGELHQYDVAAPHADASLRALFMPMLYEGYDSPEFVWQTSGGTDDNEPKFSLVPLVFGSLKGVLYAMLFSVPLAIFAAMFTSQFARRRIRGYIKPIIELMGALPSVVVGFLAGLWLSPVIDRNLQAFFNLLVFLPLGLGAVVLIFRLLSNRARQRLALGHELLFTLPFLIAAFLGASLAASPLEGLLFGGDLRGWLIDEWSVRYDRQNCFVVGIALGFAVMPIIFTVAEDAMSNVPTALRAASSALGASRWQTAWRLVLPAASPGIFAAVMLGFGRAIGETMIVVMATGNTPILDISPFNGMRTISAAIATEIPEAPVGSTLYRVLFLSGCVLFVFAFFANTAAEVVGERLRRRYSKW